MPAVLSTEQNRHVQVSGYSLDALAPIVQGMLSATGKTEALALAWLDLLFLQRATLHTFSKVALLFIALTEEWRPDLLLSTDGHRGCLPGAVSSVRRCWRRGTAPRKDIDQTVPGPAGLPIRRGGGDCCWSRPVQSGWQSGRKRTHALVQIA